MTAKTRLSRLRRWVAALRSGKYKQYSGGALKATNVNKDSYCCLGVARELFPPSTNLSPYCQYPDIAAQIGITADQESKLIEMNDGIGDGGISVKPKPFSVIADYIENVIIPSEPSVIEKGD